MTIISQTVLRNHVKIFCRYSPTKWLIQVWVIYWQFVWLPCTYSCHGNQYIHNYLCIDVGVFRVDTICVSQLLNQGWWENRSASVWARRKGGSPIRNNYSQSKSRIHLTPAREDPTRRVAWTTLAVDIYEGLYMVFKC